MNAPRASRSSASPTTSSLEVVAGHDLDLDLVAHQRHESLEDGLAGGERLGRGLRGLDLLALHGQRGARRGHLGPARAGVSAAVRRSPRAPAAARRRRGGAALPCGRGRTGRSGRPARRSRPQWGRLPCLGRRSGSRGGRSDGGRAAAVVAAAVRGRAPVAVGGARQRRGRGRLAARRGTAQRGAGRGHDAGRLGAHAQHAPAAGGQDLEVEVVEAGHAEGFARGAQGLFDALAGELLVIAHRRLPRRLVRPRLLAGRTVPAAASRGSRSLAGLGAAETGRAGAGMGDTEARRVAHGERGRPAEEREERAPPNGQILLHDREDRGHDPVDEEAGRQERAVDDREQQARS